MSRSPARVAQVDVDVDSRRRACTGAPARSPAPAGLGATEPASYGVESFQRVGQIDVGVECLVERVGGCPAVEGVVGVEVLPLDVVVFPWVPPGLIRVEGGAAQVVEGIGPSLAERPLVRRVGRVGVVGPGVEPGGDVQERRRGQVAMDLTTTEQPLRQRDRVARHLPDGALLVDELGPVPHDRRPVLVGSAACVDVEQICERVDEPRLAVGVGDGGEAVRSAEGQAAGEDGVGERSMAVAEPGQPFESVGVGLGAVGVSEQPALRRGGAGGTPCRRRPEPDQLRQEFALRGLGGGCRSGGPVEPLARRRRDIGVSGEGGGTGHDPILPRVSDRNSPVRRPGPWHPRCVVPPLRLCPLRLEDERVVRSAHESLAAAGYPFLFDHDPDEPWASFVERDDRQRRGIALPPDRVPAAFLLAWSGDQLVGRASIRFELNEYLAQAGGHIGYAVLPEHRRRGHATDILRQSLVIARAGGVRDVLVTCAVDSVGSRTVIERCGGEFESTVHDPQERVEKRRYWIR